ncbi:GNAT family N-acetyltransferase [Ruminococcus flavefaciens]|uniref:N-acetyltransferase domain-containing protein n=1 Tax=Ruminococcus flavefaciens 007c TaxID=1341157 RepID=W7ULT8_RUMFL|nr:GNAT family N-acetyltransferase [Ruminococcus flavefaciens]EWM52564.1 hypothetical protein RF007C_08485 [Ruminococcus flavefaciens 007c]
MEIRTFTTDMSEKVTDFLAEVFPQVGKPFEPDGRHSEYKDIKGNFELFLCLFDGENIIGTVAVKKLDSNNCELKCLYLYEEYQGRKLGYRLLNEAVEYAKKNGYRRILLDSMSRYQNALKLYEKFGFVNTERYNDNAKADVFMVKELV